MNAVLSPRDWQLLSEYLDNQLGPGVREQVESNITANPDWAEGLKSLESTRLALKSAPLRKAPRNYTLTTLEAASYRRNRFSFPFLKLSSAFSAALTLLFLVLGITSQNLAVPAMMASAPAMELAADSSTEATTVPIIIWGSPEMNPYAYGMGGAPAGGMGGGGGGDLLSAAEAPVVGKAMEESGAALAPEALPAPEMPETAIESEPSNLAPAPLPTSQPTVAAMEAPAPSEAGNPILGIQPATEPQAREIAPEPDQQEKQSISPWWLAAFGCLLLSGFLGYLGWKPAKPRHE